jgi:hypothetical protein
VAVYITIRRFLCTAMSRGKWHCWPELLVLEWTDIYLGIRCTSEA